MTVRWLGRQILTIGAVLLVTACTATVAPSTATTAAPSPVELAPSSGASPSPTPFVASSPSIDSSAVPTETPATTPEPTQSPDPTETPGPAVHPTPTPLPSPRMAATCPDGDDWLSEAPDHVPQTLAFGRATIEFTSAAIGQLDGSHFVDDAIPGGVGLTPREIAVVVAPGDHIILRAVGLTLSHVSPAVGPWSEVDFTGGLANLPADLAALDWRYRSDGSISISAPTEPGDYAVDFDPRWFGDCLQGDGTAYGRLKVVVP